MWKWEWLHLKWVGKKKDADLLYGLFDSEWDPNLQNEHHAVLKKT